GNSTRMGPALFRRPRSAAVRNGRAFRGTSGRDLHVVKALSCRTHRGGIVGTAPRGMSTASVAPSTFARLSELFHRHQSFGGKKTARAGTGLLPRFYQITA